MSSHRRAQALLVAALAVIAVVAVPIVRRLAFDVAFFAVHAAIGVGCYAAVLLLFKDGSKDD